MVLAHKQHSAYDGRRMVVLCCFLFAAHKQQSASEHAISLLQEAEKTFKQQLHQFVVDGIPQCLQSKFHPKYLNKTI